MKTIIKGSEPNSLTEYRAKPGANYEDFPDKASLRAFLVKEQGGLCCYCLSRIRNAYGGMKIEHWHSQRNHTSEQLDYLNLLGACMGNEGKVGEKHCDTSKADSDLSRNPANPMHRVEDITHFSGDGRVFSTDSAFNSELQEVLNLNLPFLKNNRRTVLDAFKDGLSKRGTLPRKTLEKWLLQWTGETNGKLEPYCQVVVYWLRKKLARA